MRKTLAGVYSTRNGTGKVPSISLLYKTTMGKQMFCSGNFYYNCTGSPRVSYTGSIQGLLYDNLSETVLLNGVFNVQRYFYHCLQVYLRLLELPSYNNWWLSKLGKGFLTPGRLNWGKGFLYLTG